MLIVTGGAGFIGSNLVAALEQRAPGAVAVCDRLESNEKWRNLQKRELSAIVPPEGLFEFLEANRGEIEAVFHLGAISATTETDADLVIATNFTLSERIWDWCAEHGVRLFYASSAATYGGGEAGFDDDFSVDGLATLLPLNAYGWSKHLFDRRVARLVASNAPRPPQWAGAKFFNVYGPNEYHKGAMKSVVAQMVPRIVEGKPVTLFRSHRADVPDGGQRRDFVHVDDVVDMMLFLYDNPRISGLFNMGSGKARSFLDLAHAVFAAMEREPRIDWVDTPEAIRAKYQYFTEARLDRLRAAGYEKPTTPLEEGVARYVRNYLLAEDPYR
jgi:ADP-L-glycero-D-manno-heptose 6-epimerase